MSNAHTPHDHDGDHDHDHDHDPQAEAAEQPQAQHADHDGLEGKQPSELTPEELRLMADTMPGDGPGD